MIYPKHSNLLFTTEYQAVLNRAVSLGYALPTHADRVLQNQLVVDLKADGIWTYFDVFYPMLTNIDFAKINWKTPTANALTFPGTTPTYSASVGFTGNATNMYINTNWAPSSGTNYTLDECAHGAFIITNGTDERNMYGTSTAADDNTNAMNLRPRAGGGNSNCRINSSAYADSTGTTDSSGLWHVKRLTSATTGTYFYHNGTQIATNFAASTGRSTQPVYILAENQNGTVANYNANNIACFWAGASLTGLESSFSTTMNAFYP